jgi:hypothetical protein
MTSREHIHRERALLRSQHGALYDELVALLFRHDPMHINFATNMDEYDPEVRTILPRLASCSSPEDVARVVHEEFVRWFHARLAGPLSRYEPMASEIWRLWIQRAEPGD